MKTNNKELALLIRELKTELRSISFYRYLKFPEEIVEITGGYIAVSTIRSWKTQGYLPTIKIGAKTYVTQEDWDWFLVNHQELMAKNTRNRGKRLGRSHEQEQR